MSPEKKIKQEYSVGIDISGGYVRLAEISGSEKKIKLENFIVSEIPKEKDGTVSSASVSAALKDSFMSLPPRKRKVFCLLSGTEVVIRRVLIPKLKDKDLLEAVKWEIKSHIPFTVENTVLDYKLMGSSRDKGIEKLDILVAAVSKDAIIKTHDLFEASGIQLDGISVVPFAAWNLLKRISVLQKDKITAFINIGSDITSIVIFNGEDLDFFRELSIAGNNFTKAMIGLFVSDQWKMDITYDQAEKIKRKYGIPEEGSAETTEDNIPLAQISQLLRPVLRRFINEVIRSFSFYKENFQKETIDRVIISGGSSKLKNLDSFLSSGLETNVQYLDDLIDLDSEDHSEKLKEALPHLSAAVGMALSQAKEMDLLKRAKIGRKLELPFGLDRALSSLSDTDNSVKVPSIIGGAIVIIFAVAAFSAVLIINNKLSEYDRIIENKRVILNNVKLLSERRSIINRISSDQLPVRQIMAEVTNILPGGVLLNSYSFTSSSKQIVISGTCSSMKTVGLMLKHIERSTVFTGTTLLEAKRSAGGGGMDFKVLFRIGI